MAYTSQPNLQNVGRLRYVTLMVVQALQRSIDHEERSLSESSLKDQMIAIVYTTILLELKACMMRSSFIDYDHETQNRHRVLTK
jgi:hypothetical protein